MREVLISMGVKAVRTFAQAFAFNLSVSALNIVDLSTARTVFLAAGAAGVAAVWRAFDTTQVPSLVDPYPSAGVPH